MSFWQQLNQLLSESPGNIVFHLVTLFAIQATLAIALGQWRRERALGDETERSRLAARLTLSAFGLLVTRIALLAVSLVVAANPDASLAGRVLPPLEQFVNTTMAILIVWTLVPIFRNLPRLTDVVAVLMLLLAGVMYTFFAQNWAASAQAGMTYNGSEQSTFWGVLQIGVLVAGALAVLFRFEAGYGLRLFTLLALLAAHAAHFWDYPETVPTQSEIPFWIRLGHLVALPMLAIIAYRHAVDALIAARLTNRPAPEQVANALHWASRLVGATSLQEAAREGVQMVSGLTGAGFAAIATLRDEDREQLDVQSAGTAQEEPRAWALKLRDWPAFRMAMDRGEAVELFPDGVGARQLHDLYQELGIGAKGPLLVVPLLVEEEKEGVLLLGGPPQGNSWPDKMVAVAATLSAYVTEVIAKARAGRAAQPDEALERALLGVDETLLTPPSAEPAEDMLAIAEIGAGRMIALEQERERVLEENRALHDKLQHAETRRQAAQQQARDLAATIEELERTRHSGARINVLEAEIAALKESLALAEDALALAAAAEGELNTEWVTAILTRYSGELEENQHRIAALEEELEKRDPQTSDEIMTALVQDLRTPLTSIAGYTDLLLGETLGILGSRQRDFLHKVRANVERMGVLLEQIVQLSAAPAHSVTIHDVELIDVQEVIDRAVNTVIAQLRKKDLRLNFHIARDLPPAPGNRDALYQVLIHLLNNAMEVSHERGEMTIMAHADTYEKHGADDSLHAESFIHLSVRDSGGGIRPEDRSHVFDPQYRAENPLIGGLGDTGAGLAVVHMLVSAHGGRVWVESEMGSGSTFSVLLPLSGNGQGPEEA